MTNGTIRTRVAFEGLIPSELFRLQSSWYREFLDLPYSKIGHLINARLTPQHLLEMTDAQLNTIPGFRRNADMVELHEKIQALKDAHPDLSAIKPFPNYRDPK